VGASPIRICAGGVPAYCGVWRVSSLAPRLPFSLVTVAVHAPSGPLAIAISMSISYILRQSFPP
jgi:hypothetical protein